jgi:nucleoid DNA-binding protein
MNKSELVQQLAARPPVKRREDAEAILDGLASIIWHALERGEPVQWPGVGTFSVVHAARDRRTVVFTPASEMQVAANRHAEVPHR